MIQFIDDLIPLILDSDEHWWPCHLATLATVSSTWLFYVRKRLYSCPDIRSFAAAQKLANTVKNNSNLSTFVHGLSLQPETSRFTSGTTLSSKCIRDLLQLKDLKRLTIGGDLTGTTAMYLRLIAYPEVVEEIHINGPARFSSPLSVVWDDSFTFGFPNLKTLRLSHIYLDIMPTTAPYPATFTHLILEDISFFHGNMLQLLSGATTLDCLHVTSSDAVDDELREVLSSCAVNCLHYDIKKGAASDLFADLDSRHGESVLCLHLDGHFMDVDMLRMFNEVFRNLEELVVTGRLVRISPKEWTAFILSGGFTSLRRLVLPSGTNVPPFTAWEGKEMRMIRDACLSRSISLIGSK